MLSQVTCGPGAGFKFAASTGRPVRARGRFHVCRQQITCGSVSSFKFSASLSLTDQGQISSFPPCGPGPGPGGRFQVGAESVASSLSLLGSLALALFFFSYDTVFKFTVSQSRAGGLRAGFKFPASRARTGQAAGFKFVLIQWLPLSLTPLVTIFKFTGSQSLASAGPGPLAGWSLSRVDGRGG